MSVGFPKNIKDASLVNEASAKSICSALIQ